MARGTCLKFVKVLDVSTIPRYLLEQVKPKEYDIDKFYEWAPILVNNPMNIMGAFIDKKQEVKGTMWCTYNPMTNKIHVNLLSVDKEYFGKGILKEAEGILNRFKKQVGASSITFTTTRPGAFEKIGYNKTQAIVMEK